MGRRKLCLNICGNTILERRPTGQDIEHYRINHNTITTDIRMNMEDMCMVIDHIPTNNALNVSHYKYIYININEDLGFMNRASEI
jgi:hypothetical protein